MIFDLIARILIVCFAYFIAVFAAAAFFVLAALGLDSVGPTAGETTVDLALRLGLYAGLMASTAGAIATLPILLAIAIAEAFRLSGPVFHLTLGAIVGGIGVVLWEGSEARAGQQEYVIAIASGAVGAFVYWLIAGRKAGEWRDRTTMPAPPEA